MRRLRLKLTKGQTMTEYALILSAVATVIGFAFGTFFGFVAGYFRDRDSLEPISRVELLARIKDGLVTVLDVRPEDEFASGHLPGAVNVPLSQLRKRLTELPQWQEVIAYCRGPRCVLAFEAVALLRAEGRTARRLDGGLPEWKIAGLPVEKTKPEERS